MGHNSKYAVSPVHSPLLRASYLVSNPPLTNMLKFSRFPLHKLMSCTTWCKCDGALRRTRGAWGNMRHCDSQSHYNILAHVAFHANDIICAKRHLHSRGKARDATALAHTTPYHGRDGMCAINPELCTLSGVSRKGKLHSMTYWLTASCNSQCILHFATLFIVVWAQASIAKSYVFTQRYEHQSLSHSIQCPMPPVIFQAEIERASSCRREDAKPKRKHVSSFRRANFWNQTQVLDPEEPLTWYISRQSVSKAGRAEPN